MSNLRERLQRRRAEMARNERREKLILMLVVLGFAIAAIVLYLQSNKPAGIFSSGPVNLNKASAAQLEKLPEVGPAMAEAIIDGRPYEKVEDLLKVKGIGPKTLEKIEDLVEVEED